MQTTHYKNMKIRFLLFLSILIIFNGLSCTTKQVTIEDNVMDEGQECFKITIKNATFLYQKEAGGFSSILDRDGVDWIAYKQDSVKGYPANAASEYRGLPNLVFGSDDSGAGHPGFTQCTSEIISKNQIKTLSKSGKWEWIWTFYMNYAELSFNKIEDRHNYWFLYEGIPGGKFDPQYQYWGTDQGGPLVTIPDYYMGNAVYENWRWIYFGENSIPRVFFCIQVIPDNLIDTFSYLGSTENGVIAPEGMVVFGFGRMKNAQPLLNNENQRFIIGFHDHNIKTVSDHSRIEKEIDRLIKKY